MGSRTIARAAHALSKLAAQLIHVQGQCTQALLSTVSASRPAEAQNLLTRPRTECSCQGLVCEQLMRRMQNMMSFDMWKYLWGLAGPAQCVELLSNLPMKVYMVPRNGEPAQASLGLAQP